MDWPEAVMLAQRGRGMMVDKYRDVPNTSKKAAAEGFNVGYKEPGKSYWELNNDLISEAYARLLGVRENAIDKGRHHDGTVIDVSAAPYNAPKTGDGTAEVQQAIDDLPAEGGTLVFPHMVDTSDTLNATNRRNIRWVAKHGHNSGQGTHDFTETGGIQPLTHGKPAMTRAGVIAFISATDSGLTSRETAINHPKRRISAF